jgi:hypothetical protein
MSAKNVVFRLELLCFKPFLSGKIARPARKEFPTRREARALVLRLWDELVEEHQAKRSAVKPACGFWKLQKKTDIPGNNKPSGTPGSRIDNLELAISRAGLEWGINVDRNENKVTFLPLRNPEAYLDSLTAVAGDDAEHVFVR